MRVIAKPAEETPLIAAQAVALFHEAGVPREALQLAARRRQGRRAAGRQSGDRRRGVHRLDRGRRSRSTAQLAQRLDPRRPPAADRRDRRPERPGRRFLGVARAARARRAHLGLRFGRPALLGAARALPAGRHRRPGHADAERRDGRARASAIPTGSVDRCRTGDHGGGAEAARSTISTAMRAAGHAVHQAPLPRGARTAPSCRRRSSRSRIADLPGEVFGPVLHVLRYRARGDGARCATVNATGFGLTFGVHSRIDETIDRATAAQRRRQPVRQPQHDRRRGRRAAVRRPRPVRHRTQGRRAALRAPPAVAARRRSMAAQAASCAGPVGERNSYALRPKGTILCVAADPAKLRAQHAAVQAHRQPDRCRRSATPASLRSLFAGSRGRAPGAQPPPGRAAGPIVPVHVEPYPREFLVDEVSLSVNTAAAGGNASLMAIG